MLDPQAAKARPGKEAGNEEAKIQELADSMRDPLVGQLTPILVYQTTEGFKLVDGRRRHRAAVLIESQTGQPFPLSYIALNNNRDVLKSAIHANLKRRSLTPPQFALMIQHVRNEYKWIGTKQVSDYLGVSRATISQHDKLLHQPAGMPDHVYKDLLEQLNSGRMGAETAFFALTKVEPAQSATVVTNATQKAQIEAVNKAAAKAARAPLRPVAKAPARKTSPAAPKRRESASGKASPPAPTTPLVRVTTKHVRQAAQEANAIIKQTDKKLADFDRMAEELALPGYPDPMRSFLTIWFREWKRGDATDKHVKDAWGEIAKLVNKGLDRLGFNAAPKPRDNKVKKVATRS